jgi:hypothetical protein
VDVPVVRTEAEKAAQHDLRAVLRLIGQDECDLTNYINHSCDPNVWMQDEVTLQARRDIAIGEELTIDYAMFEGNENWIPPWTCRCGSARCREKFTGMDWRREDLQERYQDHFSPFINERIQRTKASPNSTDA